MSYKVMFSAALLMAFSHMPAYAQSPIDLLKQAVDAQGGADALRAVTSVVVKGEGKFWSVGQSFSPHEPPPFHSDSTLTASIDLAGAKARYDWERDLKIPFPRKFPFSEVRFPTYGAVIDDKGQVKPMSGNRHATTMREALRGDAWMGTLQLAALDAPKNVSGIKDQTLGDQTFPAIQYSHGPHTFIMLFDRTTKLPVSIRNREADRLWGDSNYDMILSDWKKVGNVTIAHTRSFKINDIEAQRLTLKDVALNATIAPETFLVPDAVKAAAKPTPTTNVPYQWVLRGLASPAFYSDTDPAYVLPGPGIRLDQLAPNVLYTQGAVCNNMVVEMKDGLVVFEAPVGADQSRWLLDQLKVKYPGKPIKYLVLSHHHFDHISGMRQYAAEGATIVVPAPNKAYFEQVLKAPNTVEPDALQKAPKNVPVVEVKDSFSIKDDTVEIHVYNMPNPHANGFLMSHVVKENFVYSPDMIPMFGPTVPRMPTTVAVGDELRKRHITGATIVGGHGGTAKQADIGPALAAN